MRYWINRLVAVALMLSIGAAPLCACPAMESTTPVTAPAHHGMTGGTMGHSMNHAMDPAMPCCQADSHQPTRPVSTPTSSHTCDHCVTMISSHVTVEKATPAVPSFHWIAAIAPVPIFHVAIGTPKSFPSVNESPPGLSGGLFQLHCRLTL